MPLHPSLLRIAGLWLATTHAATALAADESELRYFDLRDVRIAEGPFARAQELGHEYLLAHDVERFLAPFRIEAGLEVRAPKYPNWESTGLDGHTAGHYLTALAQMWAATGDAEMKRRLDAMVTGLAECQAANGDGYVGGVPGGRRVWSEVASGKIEAHNFGLNGTWVPWYNLHKTFAGLRDAWLVAGNSQARDVLVKLSDWCERLVSGLTDEQMQDMLRSEHGGMNEVLADVAAITGEGKYLALAQRFSHRAILDPLLAGEDKLTGLHANTQIPKVIGFARIGELTRDPSLVDASEYFRRIVVERRSVAFGGNSVREHFHPADDFTPLFESREGPETCNTYNMLRLTEQLFRGGPRGELADYYERALYNHILSSQHPEHGGFVYFTPIRPRHYRVYSQPKECFWCCVGSGMENHGKYGHFVFAHRGAELFVNLFVASELQWMEQGLRVRQDTAFPDESVSRLRFAASKPIEARVHVRRPEWVGEGFAIRVNGAAVSTESVHEGYVAVERTWSDGDVLEVYLPMTTRVERLPDGSDRVAVMHGPILLAAATGPAEQEGLIAGDGRMAHIAPGAYLPLDGAPMLVGEFDRLADSIRPVEGASLEFTASDLILPNEFDGLRLVPFFRIHDSRYMMYWGTATPARYEEVVAAQKAAEQERLALDARTLDQITPGEQQPEVEHRFAGSDTATGVHVGRTWRDAGGWFGYDLRVDSSRALQLIVTYDGGQRGRRFAIEVGGEVITEVETPGGRYEQFVDVAYDVPAELVARATKEGRMPVRFVAREGSRTASIYGLRLVRP
ncbi:glycoside hydrolase family 127 protein [Opitutales bacterium ASA1]|uniref:beta-L-arabinofuranosidase domain-containing protein n=1 Tax=Congregicoccus parvus TaxID=3081749 RepID=UPI002B2839BC|nr:glycoside hydrolase family 127 protein [Opitutales bacterium ASA1]